MMIMMMMMMIIKLTMVVMMMVMALMKMKTMMVMTSICQFQPNDVEVKFLRFSPLNGFPDHRCIF